jgi:hypothetical protein
VPLDRSPFQVAWFEVTVAVYPHQPEVRAGLVANVGVKVGETFEPELNAFIVKVLRLPRSRVAALALLPMVGTVSRSPALDATLSVLYRCRPGCSVIASAGFDETVTQMPTLHVHSPATVTQASIDATAFFEGASLPDDNQAGEAFTARVVMIATSNCFKL